MKLTLILLTATFLQVSAATYAQKITLKVKGATIKEVFEKIQAQTSYDFLYNADDLKASKPITLNVKNTNLKDALDDCFKNQPLTYTIENTTILITRKAAPVVAQVLKKTITGMVTDTAGLPLPGVTVHEKGTQNAVSTDVSGKYSISVADNGAVLVFSFLGYVQQEVPVTDNGTISIRLKEANTKLNEVVVVGYGTQTRASINGAVNTVGAKDIGDKPVLNAFQALQGESPNLIIQQSSLDPGATPTVNIRGVGTTGSNDPLVVIDGIVTQSTGSLNTINPNDIANVTILKDAGSAAIYGSRAANGVILITTKSGKLNQKAAVTYNGSYGLQVPDIMVHKISAAENAYDKNMALVNSGLAPAYTPEQIQELANEGRGTWDLNHLVYNAPLQSHNLNISGGGETNSYFISGGYLDQMNSFVGNGGSGSKYGYQKYNLRLNQTSIIGKFKFNAILNYTKSRNKTTAANEGFTIADANRVPSNFNWQDANGNYLTNPVSSQQNALGMLRLGGFNQTDYDEIFGNLNGTLTITKDLKLTGVFGGTLDNNGSFYNDKVVDFLPAGASANNDLSVNDGNYKSNLFNTQLYLSYNKSLGKHSISATAGVSSETYSGRGFSLSKSLTDPTLGTPTTGTTISPTGSNNSVGIDANSLLSVFGRVNYNYESKYFLDFVFRDDASSKFAPGKRASFFPSVTAGWVVTDEDFMKPITNTLTNLKLRSSYGILGNQNVGNFQYETTYFNYTAAYGFNNQLVGGAGTFQSNPDLTWESAATFNLGVDFSLFNGKLSGSFDYFNKVTRNILQTPQDVPSIFGAGLADANVAKVRDAGWEAALTYNLRGQKVSQSFSINVADNQNTLLKLTGTATQQINQPDVYALIRKVGSPITEYYGYETNGLYQNQADIDASPKIAGLAVSPGDLKFKDLNHDGVIDSKDKTELGNPFPRYTFGFTYRIAVAGFDATIFIQGVGKRDEFLRGELVEPYQGGYGATLYDHQTDFWTPENPGAKYPRLATSGPSNVNNWQTGSDLFKYNAAYARLKNVNIGYTLPKNIVKKLGINNVRVSLIGQNLATLTKLKFADPETSEFGSNVAITSSSNSPRSYLLSAFYGVGIDLTF
ncbi:TonB-dependent receptor [Mucilaginibacter sp. BJC16-A38]|uniref:TonB-dependent receptor n=1 Tax=Mucilaginibacter phenanthrenivorans TaxID=1234842 RepID=UPI00215854BB|nr:TonB-dependent receptor [Mucilaginibacter phenanthrenivorans]MCR8559791.1 TonB-dependent receptor [Mucilaginibacter phenanthrenivorans]